ncbi:MAG TPA: DNA polymerase III subunit delta [Rhodothermales bacterium]|nr:DNA polymerase III subunit delta [Rhodothermales bacterium]
MADNTGAGFDDLATAFRHGNFRPLYFLYGEEAWFMDELQALLIEHALQPHERDFNLDLVYGHESSAPDVLARCASFPMMAERRVVVVRGFEQLADNRLFQSYAERPNPQATVLLLCNGKPNLTQHPYRALKQHAVWAEFKPLYDRQMPGWIAERLKKRGYRASGAVAQRLAERVGPHLRVAAGEIEKLIAYVGESHEITEEDVVRAAGQSREANPFELQKALGDGDDARALTIADALLGQAANRRGEALAVVAILALYVTKLWKLTGCRNGRMTEREMAGHIGVNPFFLKEYLAAIRHFPPDRLRRAFEALLAADNELKGGSERDERTVLALMLRRMALRPAGRGPATRAARAA